MEQLAVPAAAVGGLAMAEREHQDKVLLEVLVLTVAISVALWAVAAAVLAEHHRHQLKESHKLEALVLHQQLQGPRCTTLAAAAAAEPLATRLLLAELVAAVMVRQQLVRLVRQT
jgi:hypothetical protein